MNEESLAKALHETAVQACMNVGDAPLQWSPDNEDVFVTLPMEWSAAPESYRTEVREQARLLLARMMR